MIYRTRKLIKPDDLNAGGTLFGGRLISFCDEEAAIYAMCQLDSNNIVTKLISEINFMSPAKQGDIIMIGVEPIKFGTTSISLRLVVKNKNTNTNILEINNMVFVAVDENGKPKPHGKTEAKVE